MDFLRFIFWVCGSGLTLFYSSMNVWALPTIEELLPSNEQLELVVNKSAMVRLKQPAMRVSIVSPEIADVQILEPKQILLTARSVGETSLIVWLEDKSTRTIDVVVRWNTRLIKEAIQNTLPGEAIEVLPLDRGVVLQGQVHKIGNADRAVQIAQSYAPKVINLLEIPGVHQVLLKVKIAEVARSFRQEAGIDFQVFDKSVQGGSLLNGLASGDLSGSSGLNVSEAVTLFFGLPSSNANVFVQALKEKGLLRILAEPNLVARSGESANFLAGGEFPIPVAQGGAFANAITIEYKEFGVRLQFTPTVVDTKSIRLDIAPEVSDLDFSQGLKIGGYIVPTVITRRAKTVVLLDDGQTFAIAGLISRNKQKIRKKVPLAGDIPVFGGLFRGGEISEKETELLIMVTPYLVSPLQDGTRYEMPGDNIEDTDMNPFAGQEEWEMPRLSSADNLHKTQ